MHVGNTTSNEKRWLITPSIKRVLVAFLMPILWITLSTSRDEVNDSLKSYKSVNKKQRMRMSETLNDV